MEKYLPFMNGVYTTAPGLTLLSKAGNDYNRKIFQFDETWKRYDENKIECRKEDIRKYYKEAKLLPETIQVANQFLLNQLVTEYPQYFELSTQQASTQFKNKLTGKEFKWSTDWRLLDDKNYLTLFDAVCSQGQEDVAVFQLGSKEGDEYLTAIHLCAPNHWSPEEKIGKHFNAIHEPVPAMENVTKNYHKMLTNLVNTNGQYTRFAWGIATDNRLNHHPVPPADVDPEWWKGRSPSESTQFFIRTERQNLVGLPAVNAFLFTIRTYFYNFDSLSPIEKSALISALKSMRPETLSYKGLSLTLDVVLAHLND